jgi:predicted Zn-dependent protease
MYDRAFAAYREGRLDEARAELGALLAVAPDDARAYLLLSR